MSFDLGGNDGTSFPYDNHGDACTGSIVNVEEIQQTDLTTGALAFWPDGKPKMQFRVTLQTELRDDVDDDGLRTVYLRGSRKPESQSSLGAVLAAVKATTGGSALEPGGILTLRYIGDGVASTRGYTAPKKYDATYRPPATDLGGGQQPAAAPQPAAAQPPLPSYAPPAPAPQPAAQPAPQPANGATAGIRGHLNGSPVDTTQYAAMVVAGIVPETLPGWSA